MRSANPACVLLQRLLTVSCFVTLGVACQPDTSDCVSDSDCPSGHVCTSGGGVIVSGGVCVPQAFSDIGASDVTQPSDACATTDCDADADCGHLSDECPITCATCPTGVCGEGGCVLDLTAGDAYTCVLRTDGLYCWGNNDYGQFGDNSTNPSTTPVLAMSDIQGSRIAEVEAGSRHTCARTVEGEIWCFGSNEDNQLGVDDTAVQSATRPLEPVDFEFDEVARLAVFHSSNCVVDGDGDVWCWGDNDYGQLGDAMQADHTAPVEVQGLSVDIRDVAGTRCAACAISESYLYCWGNLGQTCELADTPSSPELITTFGEPVSTPIIAGGGEHECLRGVDGRIECLGRNDEGRLGVDPSETLFSAEPVVVSGLLGTGPFETVVAGSRHSCALSRDGAVWCWGGNDASQLGDESTTDSFVPLEVELDEPARLLTAGDSHTCAVVESGAVWCWGSNSDGQLGTDENLGSSSSPVEVISF